MKELEFLKKIKKQAESLKTREDLDSLIKTINERVSEREKIDKKKVIEVEAHVLADIRNKLSPMANLCAMVEHENKESRKIYKLFKESDIGKKTQLSENKRVHKLISNEIEMVKKNIQYLSSLKIK